MVGLEVDEERPAPPRYAFIGVRSCELHAIGVQDRVFLDGAYVDRDYQARREGAFIVAVNCGQAGGTCFCVSMGTGPKATEGFDLALTEVLDDGGHCFLVEVGSERGAEVLAEVGRRDRRRRGRGGGRRGRRADARRADGPHDGHRPASSDLLLSQPRAPALGRGRRALPDLRQLHDGLPDLLLHHASRTSPTSPASEAERVRRVGLVLHASTSPTCTAAACAPSPRSRYRQWMTHKLATWIDQFGTSGCVGCGRCITWCPVASTSPRRCAAIRATDGAARPMRSD